MAVNELETKKNVKAGTLTGVVCGVLMLAFFLISWSAPVIPPIPEEEGMEVNLGNSDDGLGDVQPLIPGPPAAAAQTVNTPPRAVTPPPSAVQSVETDDNDEDAPDVSVPKTTVKKPEPTNKPAEKVTPKKTTETPVQNPQPVQRPKATYGGGDGSGPGGNNADTWNNSRSQGNTTGTGDRGKITGDPNATGYDGFGGSGNGQGYSIQGSLRGRRIVQQPTFQDDFNENAKVAVDLAVNSAGAVTSATYQPRGSTTSNASIREIALRKARQLKFAAGEEQRGTVIFDFKVTN